MRITGGEFCGRKFKVPAIEVRPTQDRVREALFSSLQLRVPGCRFLDLFAGSGAVGLEALSRGAESVCWVEANRAVFNILKSNVEKIADEVAAARRVCLRSDVFDFLSKGAGGRRFDLVFADPPYCKRGRPAQNPSPAELLSAILKSGILAEDALFVLEQGSDEPVPECDGWELVRDKRYGGSRLRHFRLMDK